MLKGIQDNHFLNAYRRVSTERVAARTKGVCDVDDALKIKANKWPASTIGELKLTKITTEGL